MAECGGSARAAILYWDTDGSTVGNNASTGANLGGSGVWSATNTNWWNTNFASLQGWTNGSDSVFWGTAGGVIATAVTASSVAFKTTGYSVNSGTSAPQAITVNGSRLTSVTRESNPYRLGGLRVAGGDLAALLSADKNRIEIEL